MVETITIGQAALLLKYKRSCSVINWCERNNVKIFSEIGTNRKYILKLQLERAKLNNFIQDLKTKYKGDWFEAFKAYMSMNIVNVVEFEEKGNDDKSMLEIKKYHPVGENEKSFLSSLLNETAEL